MPPKRKRAVASRAKKLTEDQSADQVIEVTERDQDVEEVEATIIDPPVKKRRTSSVSKKKAETPATTPKKRGVRRGSAKKIEEVEKVEEVEEVQEVQEVQDVQDVQEVQEVQDVQDVQEIEEVQEVQEAQETRKFEEVIGNAEEPSTITATPAPPPPPPASGPVPPPLTAPAPPPPNQKSKSKFKIDDSDIHYDYNIELTLRILITSNFGAVLDDPLDPVLKLLVLDEPELEGLEPRPYLLSGISVSPQVQGTSERIIAISGTCRALARAVAILSEYNSILESMASVSVIDGEKTKSGAKIASELVVEHFNALLEGASQDSDTLSLLGDFVAETGLRITLLIPEYIINQKKLTTRSLRQTSNHHISSILQKMHSNLTKDGFGKQFNMLNEIGLLTDTHFQLPRLPALVTLPMSSDYPLCISANDTKALELSVRVLLTQTLIEGKPRVTSHKGEEAAGERKKAHRRRAKKTHKKKSTQNKNTRVNDADDDDDLDDSGDEYAHGRAAIPPHTTYTPIPVAGVYGHPDTFQQQYLNSQWESVNPYHHPRDAVTLVSEIAPVTDGVEDPSTFVEDVDSAMNDYGVDRPEGDAPTVNASGQVTQYMYVPNELVGAIIGKQGVKINEIRQASGSTIKINEHPGDEEANADDGATGSGDRKVTIVGTVETNQKAMQLLYQRVEAEKRHHQQHSSSAASSTQGNHSHGQYQQQHSGQNYGQGYSSNQGYNQGYRR